MNGFAIVLLKLAALSLPLGGLAWGMRIFPRRPLLWLALIPALVSFGVPIWPGLTGPIVAIDVTLALVLAGDALTLPARRLFSAERSAGRIASLRKPHKVSIVLAYRGRRGRNLWLRDDVPHELNPEPSQFAFRAAPQTRTVLSYTLRPSRRGAFVLGNAHLRVRSRLGLWQRLIDCPANTTIHVYPDLKQLDQYALLARTNRLRLLGVRRVRRIGQDHDFERLRDYTIDDNYKHIDWRATARRRRLTVKDFQSSQSQRIIFLMDCGRMMTNQCGGLSLLDHSLNAVLMLAYVALRQGDQVGMIHFSNEIHSFVPPRAGMRQMNRLLHASFDRFPQLVESRYDQAFRYLAAHCRKRSLVVLMTNVIDEVNAHQIQRHLRNLAGRHLPLGVLLRDRRLFAAVEVEQPAGRQLWRAAAAAEILAWRHQVLADLQAGGVLSLDVFPESMTAPLVNRYLEIKARHLL
ncbi:MAG: DUF58 domain-containing protein [Thermoguttaceae bacterium]